MSELAAHVDDYLRLRRGLGFKLAYEGVLLPRFARYMTTIDAFTQVPPAGVFGCQGPRPTPYLWSEHDISRLLKAARNLQAPFRAATYESFLGLLAVSGLRSGEAMSLQADDVDLDAGVITVSQAKSGRTRLIPLHPSTTTQLRSCADRRDELHPRPRSNTFFISEVATCLKSSTVDHTFRNLVTSLELGSSTVRPRMHDLRHTFAVHTLISWHRAGHDIEARIPALVSYLGHVNPASTYWYLSASPELMGLAADRLGEHFGER